MLLLAGCAIPQQRPGHAYEPNAGTIKEKPSHGSSLRSGAERDAPSASRSFPKVETPEDLCRVLGFQNPEIPKCDELRYSQCIPSTMCGEGLAKIHEGRGGGEMQAVCPVVWIASATRKNSDAGTVWELRHVNGLGQETTIAIPAFDPPDCRNGSMGNDDQSNRIEPEFPYDYDGDGEQELLFQQPRVMYGAGFPGVLLTVKDGAARVYFSPPTGFYIDGTIDYDRDRVPDINLKLLVGGDWEEGCGGYGEAQWSSQFLAHARQDGSFSMKDEVAEAAIRKWCPHRPSKLESQDDILCALLWHTPVRPLDRRFRRELHSCETRANQESDESDGCGVERCNEERARVDLLRWKPPLILGLPASN